MLAKDSKFEFQIDTRPFGVLRFGKKIQKYFGIRTEKLLNIKLRRI